MEYQTKPVGFLFTLAVMILLLAACSLESEETMSRDGIPQDWPDELTVGYFGDAESSELLKNPEPFQKHFENELGIPVRIFQGTSYSAVIEAMRSKRVDAMEVGPFSYLLAVEEAGAEAVAVGCVTLASPAVYDPNLQPHYFSCLFTKKGNGIESLEDLRGRDFAFVDPASTSGHLAPKTLLLKSGLDPDKEMNTVFAGSHPSSLLAVWNGSMEAGATFGRNIFTQAQEGAVEYCGYALDELHVGLTPEDFQKRNQNCPEGSIIILAISDPIPETPFAVRQDLPMSLKQAIQDALLRVKDNPELVAQIRRWYVDPTQKRDIERIDHYYNSLREIAALLDLDLNALGE